MIAGAAAVSLGLPSAARIWRASRARHGAALPVRAVKI
jgi:hypothetical protein